MLIIEGLSAKEGSAPLGAAQNLLYRWKQHHIDELEANKPGIVRCGRIDWVPADAMGPTNGSGDESLTHPQRPGKTSSRSLSGPVQRHLDKGERR